MSEAGRNQLQIGAASIGTALRLQSTFTPSLIKIAASLGHRQGVIIILIALRKKMALRLLNSFAPSDHKWRSQNRDSLLL